MDTHHVAALVFALMALPFGLVTAAKRRVWR